MALSMISTARTPWPPQAWQAIYDLYAEHAAWYSGDPAVLLAYYATKSGFWAQEIEANERRLLMHIPIANDIARTSSRLLFAEHPKITLASEDQTTSDRLEELLENAAVYAKLSEAAETCSALGGVFLKVNWDKSLADYPFLSVAQADNAIPEFKFGMLVRCLFHKVVKKDGNVLFTLVERHEPGYIINELWRGTSGDLGIQVELSALAETATEPGVIETGIPGLACVYVPNMRPNPRFRGLDIGQADLCNLEGMMDSLDQAWSSWIRDIHLGLGRIMADQAFFKTDLAGNWQFDLQREAYLGLNSISGPGALKDQIVVNQFNIRAEEHEKTILNLMRQIFGMAGYAPQTFGLDLEGSPVSGYALKTMERKSILTAGAKADYWGPAIADILYVLLQVDKLQFGGLGTPERPVVEMQDSVANDELQEAQSVELFRRAQAMSIESAIRRVNPDLNDDGVNAELQRIQDEQGLGVPSPVQVGQV